MSYRPAVRDDSRATPYFYTRNNYPVKTYRHHRTDLLSYPFGTRVIGGKNPFWVRTLDYAYPKIKWLYRNRRWLKYYIVPSWYPYNAKIPKNKTFSTFRSSKLQKGHQPRTRKCSCRYYRSRYGGRRRFCSCRSNLSNRRKRTYRMYH